MGLSFGNKLAEDLFNGEATKETRHFPPVLHRSALRKLTYLNDAATLDDLRYPPGNRLERLKGDLQGFYSIRINDQWRIVFQWTVQGPQSVQIVDYH